MKWFGEIGFNEVIEEAPGVYTPTVIPKEFFGEVLDLSWKEMRGDKINSDLSISNKLSVVADPYLRNNFQKIAYVEFSGAKWTVSGVNVGMPRLELTLGSLYLEETEEDDED